MSVNMNPLSHKISSLQTYHFAKPEAKEKETALKDDAVQISPEAAEHAAGIREMDIPADPIGQKLSSMTKEEFADMLRTWQDENQVPLEVNQRASVDPDGTIWAKAYFDAYVQQAVAEKHLIQIRELAELGIGGLFPIALEGEARPQQEHQNETAPKQHTFSQTQEVGAQQLSHGKHPPPG